MNDATSVLLPGELGRGADISGCGRYRYRLWRTWGIGDRVLWVMLNPSTADTGVDDPTIRKCIGFARRWGYAGIDVVNLFAWRSKRPRDLRKMGALAVGRRNDFVIEASARLCREAICAWGNGGEIRHRGREVLDALRLVCRTRALKLTRPGNPGHPLHLPCDARRFDMVCGP